MRLLGALVFAVGLLTLLASVAIAQPIPGGALPTGGGAPLTPAVPVPTADANGVLTLTNNDGGMTVQVSTGQTITLQLTAGNGMNLWQVTPPDPTVLTPLANPGAAAVSGVTLKSFQAIGAGTTQIAATDAPNCPPGDACPQFLVAYQVTVVVTGPGS